MSNHFESVHARHFDVENRQIRHLGLQHGDRVQTVLGGDRMDIMALQNARRDFAHRDGVVNRHVGHLSNIEDFELIAGVESAISTLNNLGYLCIIVTNQPVIARGELSVDQLGMIHNKMETLLGNNGAYIDGIYYCPHHPDSGFEGEIKELKFDCDCRKPKPGMLLAAKEEFNIDFSDSKFSKGHAGSTFTIETIYRCLAISLPEFNQYSKIIYYT